MAADESQNFQVSNDGSKWTTLSLFRARKLPRRITWLL
jgi:hypothetical protein